MVKKSRTLEAFVDPRYQYKKERMVRRVKTDGEVLVKTDAGWLPEQVDVQLTPEHVCDCGFEAKSAAGLSAHERSHAEEE